MDNPFVPAMVAFGPFFLTLLYFAAMQRGQRAEKVPTSQVAIAMVASLGIGVAGAVASYLLL
jgi:uncharacterized membrane protein